MYFVFLYLSIVYLLVYIFNCALHSFNRVLYAVSIDLLSLNHLPIVHLLLYCYLISSSILLKIALLVSRLVKEVIKEANGS